MYMYGTQLWCVVIADSFVSLTMAVVYLPVFYDLGITSSYEVRNDLAPRPIDRLPLYRSAIRDFRSTSSSDSTTPFD